MKEAARELLRTFSEADGISGHEEEVRALFRARLAGAGELKADRLGSVICERRGADEHPRIMLDAHLDEVGFLVESVTSRGFVRFVPAGGWWGHVLLAQRVRIHTPKGKVAGVISSTPPHFLEPEERKKVIEPHHMYIDVGARDDKEAMGVLGVTTGCPIVPDTAFRELAAPGMVSGKAFDNRAGCAVVVQAMLELREHPNVVMGVASVQEEVGLRGATTSVAVAEPDLALVLEGAPADDTPGMEPERAQAQLTKGVQIRVFDPTMVSHRGLRLLVEETARDAGIPYQLAVRRTGGTDGGSIHKHAIGVPTVVLAIPVRYIHCHVGILCLDDYLAALRLVLAFVSRCDRGMWEQMS